MSLSTKSSAWAGSLGFRASFEEDGASDIVARRYRMSVEGEEEETAGVEEGHTYTAAASAACCGRQGRRLLPAFLI